MSTVVAFLRGVNVGGKNSLKMAALCKLFGELGLRGARAILQSGSIVFVSTRRVGPALERFLEDAIAKRFDVEIDVIVRGAAEWDAIIVANPFPEAARDDPAHLVVMPLKSPPSPNAIEALRAWIPGRESVSVVDRQLYIIYPDGIGRSRADNAAIERKIGIRGTGRNWNTSLKVASTLATLKRNV